MPGPGWYLIGEEERQEVEEVLETGYVSRYGTANNPKFRRKVVTLALSVGVVDPGLGASFGINILSTDEEIEKTAQKFVDTRCSRF